MQLLRVRQPDGSVQLVDFARPLELAAPRAPRSRAPRRIPGPFRPDARTWHVVGRYPGEPSQFIGTVRAVTKAGALVQARAKFRRAKALRNPVRGSLRVACGRAVAP